MEQQNNLRIISTIPENSGIKRIFPETGAETLKMIQKAQKEIVISAFLVSLRTKTNQSIGDKVFQAITQSMNNGVKVKLLVSSPIINKQDIEELKKYKNCTIIPICLSDLYGSGVLHQKIILVDNIEAYIGSANLTNSSYENTGELGFITSNTFIIHETIKILQMWEKIGTEKIKTKTVKTKAMLFEHNNPDIKIEDFKQFDTENNIKSPKITNINNKETKVVIGFSPNSIKMSRSSELDNIINTIKKAKKYINISVMTLVDINLYAINQDGHKHSYFENQIFDAIKEAVISRMVHVKIIVSKWLFEHIIMIPRLMNMLDFIKSISRYSINDYIGEIEIKMIKMPSLHTADIEYKEMSTTPSHVHHQKYIVTDQHLLISTSNMTPDYYYSSAGICVTFNNRDMINQMKSFFKNTWESQTSKIL